MSMPIGFFDYFTLGGLPVGIPFAPPAPMSSSRGRFAGGRQYLAYLHERRRSPIRRIRPMATQILLADAYTDYMTKIEYEKRMVANRATFAALASEF
jgi:hypothetical protein